MQIPILLIGLLTSLVHLRLHAQGSCWGEGAQRERCQMQKGKGSDTKGDRYKGKRAEENFQRQGAKAMAGCKGEGGEHPHPNVMADSKRLESPKSMT